MQSNQIKAVIIIPQIRDTGETKNPPNNSGDVKGCVQHDNVCPARVTGRVNRKGITRLSQKKKKTITSATLTNKFLSLPIVLIRERF